MRNIHLNLYFDISYYGIIDKSNKYSYYTINIHKITYCFLGLANRIYNIVIFLFFFRLEYRSRRFFVITEEQQQHFMDYIFLLSIIYILPNYITTDLPGSFKHTRLLSTAKQTKNYKRPFYIFNNQQLLLIIIQVCYLDKL